MLVVGAIKKESLLVYPPDYAIKDTPELRKCVLTCEIVSATWFSVLVFAVALFHPRECAGEAGDAFPGNAVYCVSHSVASVSKRS